MKNSFDISSALNEAFYEFAILSGEKPQEIENNIPVIKVSKKGKKELFHFDLKFFKSKYYSFQIIQYKSIS